MSLKKAIEHGKEKRKPYYGGKAIDPWCRNHGPDSIPGANAEYKEKKSAYADCDWSNETCPFCHSKLIDIKRHYDIDEDTGEKIECDSWDVHCKECDKDSIIVEIDDI